MRLCYHLGGGDHFLIEIDIAPIEELYIHEEIVPDILKRVKSSLETFGYQNDPILVDENTGVILDGMHRYQSLKELGYKYIVVAKVDYHDPSILVKNWYRVFRVSNTDEEKLRDTIQKIDENIELEKSDVLLDYKENDDLLTQIILPKKQGIITIKYDGPLDLLQKYKKIKKIEQIISTQLGAELSFKSEKNALMDIEREKNTIVLTTPPITKNDVVKFALERKVFPPKTTRHIVPVRPLFVSIPLSILSPKGPGRTYEEKREILNKILFQKTIIRVKGNVKVDRYYEEQALFIFV